MNSKAYEDFVQSQFLANHYKTLKILKKVSIIVEKLYVKAWINLTLMLFIYSASADDCQLTPKRKKFLIESSFYPVADIKCVDRNLKWIISNDHYRLKTSFTKDNLIKTSPYHVESLVLKQGTYQWLITNTPHLNGPRPRLPASVEKGEEKKEIKKLAKAPKKSIQSLAIGFYSGIASIASTDTVSNVKETAVSDLGYGLTFSWNHHWSEKISFFAVGSLKKFDFRVADNRTISKASVTHGYVGTGVNFKLGNRFSLAPGAGIGESLVLSSNGGAELSIDKINIPTLSLSTKTKLVTFKSGFSFDLNIRAGSMLPTNQKGLKTETGYYYNIGLGSNYDLSGKKLFIDSGITSRKLKIGPADQSSKDLGVSVGLGWTF